MKNTLLTAALVTLAGASLAETPTLVVYTYDSFVSDWGPGPAVKIAFEATCGCELQFVGAGDGAALLSRLRLEDSRTKADIVLGLDTNLIETAKDTGLFAPHNGIPDNLLLPVEWTDDTFLPFDWGYFAFVYNTETLNNVPDSFSALIRSDLSVVIQDPRSSTPGLGLLLWVKSIYGDDAQQAWQDFSPRIVTVTKGWSEAYGMFLQGEADMVLSYTTSPAYHLIAEGDATFAAAEFSEGHYLQIEVAAKLAGTKQPALADAFLTFMSSAEFQEIIPTTNWMYPAVNWPNIIPDGFETLITPQTSILIPTDKVNDAKLEALEEWVEALSQ